VLNGTPSPKGAPSRFYPGKKGKIGWPEDLYWDGFTVTTVRTGGHLERGLGGEMTAA
jgi:hypothetical protein